MKFRLPQFSMRVLVVVMLLPGAALGLVGRELFQIRTKAEAQRTLVEQLKSKGVRFVEEDRADLTILESLAVWLEGKRSLSVVSKVTLTDVGIHEDDLNQIARLEGLKTISDQGAHFSDKGLVLSGQNPTLQKIFLYHGWNGTEAGATALVSGKAPLSVLLLQQSAVNDDFVARVSKLPKLEALTFDARNVSAKALASLEHAPLLSYLSLEHARGIGEVLNALANHPKLVNLRLFDYHFGGGELEALANANQLEGLTIETDEFPAGVLRAVSGMKNLKALALCGEMHENEQFHPFQSTRLERIGIEGLPNRCEGMIDSLAGCKALINLLLADVALTDSELERLATIKGLQSIALGTGPSSEAISRLQKSLPNCTVTMRDRQRRILLYQPGGAFELRMPPPLVEKGSSTIDKEASAKN